MSSSIVIALPLVYLALQWAALAQMERGWRAAAALPLLVMTAALVVMVIGLAAGASLAPVAVMLGLPAATAYLAILWPLHFLLRGG